MSSVESLPAVAEGVFVGVASASDCPQGGSTIVTFLDSNGNKKWDDGETTLTSTSLCNGVNGLNGLDGKNGLSAGIKVESAALGSCPAGGLSITTFIDSNSDGKLQDSEVMTSFSTVCNGVAGKDGKDGLNGLDGESAHLTVITATKDQCPAGGSVYSSSLGSAPAQETVICNGVAGKDGKDGKDGLNGSDGKNASYSMGAIGPSVAGKAYTACHHDYLFLPNLENSSLGWLMIRHQKNGAQDQGIGSTGFNVWNVDMVDFAVASEVGGVTYCTLHWDLAKKTLSYKVVDKSDGLQGITGSIEL